MLNLSISILCLLGTLALASQADLSSGTTPCPNATRIGDSTWIQAGDAQVHMTSFSCPGVESSKAVADVNITANSLTARTNDVCGVQCTIVSCLGTGDVPLAGDCAIIGDAIDILSADLGSTYQLTAANGYYKQLVYNTCLTYIGVSAEVDTEACWSDWSHIIRQLLGACPGSPIGGCTAFAPALEVAAFSMEIRATESV